MQSKRIGPSGCVAGDTSGPGKETESFREDSLRGAHCEQTRLDFGGGGSEELEGFLEESGGQRLTLVCIEKSLRSSGILEVGGLLCLGWAKTHHLLKWARRWDNQEGEVRRAQFERTDLTQVRAVGDRHLARRVCGSKTLWPR